MSLVTVSLQKSRTTGAFGFREKRVLPLITILQKSLTLIRVAWAYLNKKGATRCSLRQQARKVLRSPLTLLSSIEYPPGHNTEPKLAGFPP